MKKRIAVASSLLIYCGLTMAIDDNTTEDLKKKSVVFLDKEVKELKPKEELDIRLLSSWDRLELITKEGERIAEERIQKQKQKEHDEWVASVKAKQEEKRKERLAEEKRQRELQAQREKERQQQLAKQRQVEEQPTNSSVKTMTVNVSAYTYAEQDPYVSEKWGNKTFTGVDVHYGVVAVDPNVIPLHTKMKIEGFGDKIFTALDTGNAIKGNKIDLFLPSYDECIQFGKRNLKIYILN